jgi:hypothetical protein
MVARKNEVTSLLRWRALFTTVLSQCPVKIEKATLSQTAVTVGVLTDKIRILRGQGLDPDPANELCRLLGIHRDQLPERLELESGEQLPEGFAESLGPIIDVKPEPESVNQSASDQSVTSVEGSEDASTEATAEKLD